MVDYEQLPVNFLAEALHSVYSTHCGSHALEECMYTQSRLHPIDFEAQAMKVRQWLIDNSPNSKSIDAPWSEADRQDYYRGEYTGHPKPDLPSPRKVTNW